MTCPKCGYQPKAGNQFCPSCGTRIYPVNAPDAVSVVTDSASTNTVPTKSKKPENKRLWILVAVILLLVILLLGSLALNAMQLLNRRQNAATDFQPETTTEEPSPVPAAPTTYSVTWTPVSGCQIQVSRTASPNADAFIGDLLNGSTVYSGDVLRITYTPHTGYTLTESGLASITVDQNITDSHIYATVQLSSYSYSIIHQSTNGTFLGSDTATFAYGTTNAVLPGSFPGYSSPSYQNVTWDSTTGKTILFLYAPKETDAVVKSDIITQVPGYKLEYSATVSHRNRTATSVDIRISWTSTISGEDYFNNYAQWFRAVAAGVSIPDVEVAPYGTWRKASSSARSESADSPWITVPLTTTDATSIDLSIYYFQVNDADIDVSSVKGMGSVSETWTIPIPAY